MVGSYEKQGTFILNPTKIKNKYSPVFPSNFSVNVMEQHKIDRNVINKSNPMYFLANTNTSVKQLT